MSIDFDRPNRSSVDVEIEADSIETGVVERDNHARSAGFLDVATYPRITFRSREIRPIDGDRAFWVLGDLTIRNVTRGIVVAVERGNAAAPLATPQGHQVRLVARATLNRSDFRLVWAQESVASPIGGDTIDLEIQVDLHPA